MEKNRQTYGFDQSTDPAILSALAHDGYSGHFARLATAAGWKAPPHKLQQPKPVTDGNSASFQHTPARNFNI